MPPIAPALPRPPRAVPRAPRRATGRAAAGMALIAVLWIVAALALLVSGMTETVRRQVRQTSAVRDAVSAAAAGQAAIQLALQDLQANAQRPDALMRRDIDFDGVPISVELLPVTGLVSVNGAPAELLQAVLTYAGGLPPGAAAQAAQAIVDWRSQPPTALRSGPPAAPPRFDAVEDLMLVPGLDYSTFARIRPLLTSAGNASRVDPRFAPPAVLAVLARGNMALAAAIDAQRASARPGGADTSGLDGALVGSQTTTVYRLSARVPLEEGKILTFVQDTALRPDPASRAPWRELSAEWRIEAAGPPRLGP